MFQLRLHNKLFSKITLFLSKNAVYLVNVQTDIVSKQTSLYKTVYISLDRTVDQRVEPDLYHFIEKGQIRSSQKRTTETLSGESPTVESSASDRILRAFLKEHFENGCKGIATKRFFVDYHQHRR